MISEATLESRIHAVFKDIFPWMDSNEISHQDYFTIRLGHGNATIKNKSKLGRSDILIRYNDLPIILFELKAPDEEITDDDKKQGLSYARLTDPITPITIVSNSNKTILLNTYSGDELSFESLDNYSKLATQISKSLTIASANIEDAIDTLTGGSIATISSLFAKISVSRFENLSGECSDMHFPICKDFSIKRTLPEEIFAHIKSNQDQNLIILSGPAQIGKTNAVVQLSKLLINNDDAVLFIEPNSSAGVFSCIESAVYSEYKISLPGHSVLNWVRQFVLKGSLYIIIDRATPDIFEKFREDILTLMDVFKSTRSAIVMVTDLITSEMEFKSVGRKNYSTITNRVKIFKLKELSPEEFIDAQAYLSNHGVYIDSNHIGTPEFRNPRLLRNILKTLPSFSPNDQYALGPGVIADIMDISISGNMIDDELVEKLQNFGKAFIDQVRDSNNPKLNLYSMEIGCVNTSILRKYLSDLDIKLLEEQGLIEVRKIDIDYNLAYPRDPITFITATAPILIKSFQNDNLFTVQYKEFINNCSYFPSSDLLTVYALKLLLEEDISTFSNVISHLVEDCPKIHSLVGKKFQALIKIEEHVVNCNFDFTNVDDPSLDMEIGIMQSDYSQWRVLSLLLSSEWFSSIIELKDYIRLVYKIGSYEKTLYRTFIVKDSGASHASHTFGKFEIGCSNHGAIEPISMALEQVFLKYPKIFESISNHAISINNFPLICRLLLVLPSLQILQPNSQLFALKTRIKDAHDRCLKILTGRVKQERNERCICQSGIKFKKCCGK